jgi:putative nucleotidyltransferase with HDIG domain
MDYSSAFAQLEQWYESYGSSFLDGPEPLRNAVLLKREHTKRVGEEMAHLCESITLARRDSQLAAMVALLHDVGRFEQFKTYGTFSDRRSQNHAELALKIIAEFNLLSALDPRDGALVEVAVCFHNAPMVPPGLTERERLFCGLIRDADKLDIYRITTNHYRTPDPRHKETIDIGIPDGAEVSEAVCRSVLEATAIDYAIIKTVSDFKLIQIGWVYDLYLRRSCELMRSRGYFDLIAAQLPQTPLVVQAVEKARHYLDQRIALSGWESTHSPLNKE